MDGRTVVVVESDELLFSAGVPMSIHDADLANTGDRPCPALQQAFALDMGDATNTQLDSATQDEASASARYDLDLASARGCTWATS